MRFKKTVSGLFSIPQSLWGVLVLLLGLMNCFPVAADDDYAPAIVGKFQSSDKDGNGTLSAAEYVASHTPVALHQRDFRLADLDDDGALDLDEFAPIANGWEPYDRGEMPDPVLDLSDMMATAFDPNYPNWEDQPETPNDGAAIVAAIAKVLSLQNTQFADTDGNSQISRSEAKISLESLLGIRLSAKRPLRSSNGRVLNHLYFLVLDVNKDQKIDVNELAAANWLADIPGEFAKRDTDSSGGISFEEWQADGDLSWHDPIRDFRRLDTNFDALVSPEEIAAGTPDWKKGMNHQLFPAFDLNADGQLSLNEYRLSPHGNVVLTWQAELGDTDGDQRLSFSEYTYDSGQFPLLRLFYFRRFDRNHDNQLEREEFRFKGSLPKQLFTINADGTELKQIEMPHKLLQMGSPSVSPDGEWIAFDGTDKPNAAYSIWNSYVVPIVGGEPRAVVVGLMPTWSADSRTLCCSRQVERFGIWTVDVEEGGHKTFIGDGWGGQWSPDGSTIYYTNGNVVMLFDVETKSTTQLSGLEKGGYQYVEYNATWSPDNRRIAARGVRNDGTQEVILFDVDVDVDGENVANLRARYRTSNGGQFASKFAWHPSGKPFVFAMHNQQAGRTQLYQLDPDAEDPPELFPGQPPTMTISGPAWTPDGKRLVVVGVED